MGNPAQASRLFRRIATARHRRGGDIPGHQKLADAAGEGADVALSLNVVAWNSAIAGSGVVGGVLLDTWGVASFAWAMLVLIGVALAIVWAARAHGFRPGRRAGVETATQ